jgi:hypothetical protein
MSSLHPECPDSDVSDHSVAAEMLLRREKYGAKDVKKYYAKFDVSVVVELG